MAEENVTTNFENDGSIGPTVQNAEKIQQQFGGFDTFEDQLQNYANQFNVNEITGKGGFTDDQFARYLLDNAPGQWDKDKILESFTPGQIIAKFTNAEEITGIRRVTDPLIKGGLEVGAPFGAAALSYGLFAPVTGPLVAAIPAASTWRATQIIGQNISKELFPYEILPEQRALFESMYTFGGGLNFTAAPYMFAKSMLPGTLSYARNLNIMANGGKLGPVDRIGMAALQRPFLTAGTELSALGGASFGTYAAEKSDPGNMPKRLLSELMYGFGGPTAAFTATRGAEKGIDVIKKFFETSKITTQRGTYDVPTSQRNNVSQLFKRSWIKHSGDEDQFNLWFNEVTGEQGIRLLADIKGQYGPRTTASLTGDSYLMALQKKLMLLR